MVEQMTEECGGCKFWTKRSDELGERGGGYCRRYPPAWPPGLTLTMTKPLGMEYSLDSDGRYNDAWPMTHQQSWCGEFEPLPPQPPSSPAI